MKVSFKFLLMFVCVAMLCWSVTGTVWAAPLGDSSDQEEEDEQNNQDSQDNRPVKQVREKIPFADPTEEQIEEDTRRYKAMKNMWDTLKGGTNPLLKPKDLLASAKDYLDWFTETFKNTNLTNRLKYHKEEILAAIKYAENHMGKPLEADSALPDFVPNAFTADGNRAFTLIYSNVGKGAAPAGKLPCRLKVAAHTNQGVLPPRIIETNINMPGPGQTFNAWIVVEKDDVDFEPGNAYDITFQLNPDREIKEENENYDNNSITKTSFIWANTDNSEFSMNEQNLDLVIKTPFVGDYAEPGKSSKLHLRVPYTNNSNAFITGKKVSCKLSVFPYTSHGLATTPSIHQCEIDIPKPGQTLDAVVHPAENWREHNAYKIILEINMDKKVKEVNFDNNTFSADEFKFER